MNIKEIAKIANVNQTTVQRWIKKIPDAKRIEIDAKCIEATRQQKPADFTLDETILIIRAGGNETLANLLHENAKQKDAVVLVTEKTDDIFKAIAYMKHEIDELKKSKIKQLPAPVVKTETPKILKRFKLKNKMAARVEWHGQTFLVMQNYENPNKYDVRMDDGREYPGTIKTGFYSEHQAIKFIERTL